MGPELGGQVAFDRVETAADNVIRQPEKRRRVFAGLDDGAIRFPDQKQAAMRLDGAGEVDLLAFAVG